jgi:DNA-binding transcriptional ArsR family regulator
MEPAMKRDIDLARQILLAIEENPDADGNGCVDVQVKGHDERNISYHIMLLSEAGLVEARDASDSEGLCWMAMRLTHDGHEFLDTSREEGIWQKAKKAVAEKAGGVSLDVIKALLVKWSTDQILRS